MGLQGVVVGGHQRGHGGGAVVARTAVEGLALAISLAQPVALPVGHPPALAVAKHQVDRAGEEALAGQLQPGQLLGVGAPEPALGVGSEWTRQGAGPHQGDGQVEIHLVEAFGLGQLGQLEPPQLPAKGRGQQLLKAEQHRFVMERGDAGPLELPGTNFTLVGNALAEIDLLEDPVQAIPGLGAPGEAGQRAVFWPGQGARVISGLDFELPGQGIGFPALFEGFGGGAVACLGPAGVTATPPGGVERRQGHRAPLQRLGRYWGADLQGGAAGGGGIHQGELQLAAGDLLLQQLSPLAIAAAPVGILVGRGGIVLVKEPGVKGVALLPLGRAPGQHEQLLGPGGGHIGKALPLLQFGLQLLVSGGMARTPVTVQVQVQQGITALRRCPAHPESLGSLAAAGGLPQVGANHHRVFQPLTAVHGHHRHGRIHPIAMGLVGVGHGAVGIEPQPPQPVGRRSRPQLV